MEQQFSLRWNNYLNQITDAFDSLRSEEDLVDVTLSCEGKKLKAHKMLLSACSTYFRDIFKENPCQHPVIVFRNVKYADLEAIIEFMYKGEVNVAQEQLDSFLGTAELLEVKGLTDGSGKDSHLEEDEQSILPKVQLEAVPESTQPIRSSLASRIQPPALFHATSASPSAKKRKYSLSVQEKPPESKQRSAASEVSSAPVVPKVEKQEYIEDLTFDEDEDDLSRPTSTEPSHTSRNPKPDSSMEYSTVSESSQDQNDASLIAMGQILLAEPGTSVEGASQESMQAEDIDGPEENKDDKKDDESVGQKSESGEEQSAEVEPETKAASPKPSEANRASSDEEPTATPKAEDKSVDVEPKKEMKSVKAPIKAQPEAKKIIPKAKDSNPSLSKGVHLPQGLTVTVRRVASQVTRSPNVSTLEDPPIIHSTEDYPSLRSEEAKTPIHEELISYQEFPEQAELQGVTSSMGQILQDEPEMAEEAPFLGAEQETADVPEEEEEKEPEFDYYGCVICKAETKPVDRFNFTHKCPICPCVCFCSHLLKEHMRVIHGWFNVQRRFNPHSS